MPTKARAVAGTLAGLLSAVLSLPVVLYVLLHSVDIDDFRGQLTRHVSIALGQSIQLDGPIRLEPSLTPRLVIAGLSIANPEWASRPYLARIQRFKAKVGLLALLRRELEILELEFHGVDLKLEEGPGTSNNYTFVHSGRSNLLPTIERMSLFDVKLTWLPYEGMARSVQLERVTVHNMPRQPMELDLTAQLNGQPLQLSLSAESQGDNWPSGPWETAIQVEVGDISLQLWGSVAEPAQWYQGSFRFELEGKDFHRLGASMDVQLPALGAYQLAGDIHISRDEYLLVSDMSGEAAGMAVAGSARWEIDTLEGRPASWQSVLETGEFDLVAHPSKAPLSKNIDFMGRRLPLLLERVEFSAGPERPLVINAQALFDNSPLDLKLRAPSLSMLVQKPQGPWQELVFDAAGDGMQLSLAGSVGHPWEIGGLDLTVEIAGPKFAELLNQSGNFYLAGHYRDHAGRHALDDFTLRLFDADFSGRMALHVPKSQPDLLVNFSPGKDLAGLLRQLELDIAVNLPGTVFDRPISLAGQTLDFGISTIHASVLPGRPLQLTTEATVNGTSVKLGMRGEPLQQLALNPAGPWRNLRLQGGTEGISFSALGDIAKPLEMLGLDAAVEIAGTDIRGLLSQFELDLPLQGLYSLNGRIRNTADSVVFDDFALSFGRSDLAGQLQYFPGGERPRILMDLRSEQFYLPEIFPGSDEVSPHTEAEGLIPDIQFPVGYLNQINARLRFSAEQLSIANGVLGDVSVALTLENQKLDLEDFSVQDWTGSRVQASGSIDAARDPLQVDMKLSARGFDYGLWLSAPGAAPYIEGTLDINWTLSGEGSSSREVLSNANGTFSLVGGQGRVVGRRLGLWGSDLITTMLSPSWHREGVTYLNCVVALVEIENGVARTDTVLVDTNRVTIAASGKLDLATEEVTFVFAPRPKRSSLVSLAGPARVTGTLSAPEIRSERLPRRRLAVLGGGVLGGLLNPAYMVFAFSQLGSGGSNPCAAALDMGATAKARLVGSNQ